MRTLIRLSTLFGIGGVLYLVTEIAWRGHTHWTMFIAGGLCFVLVGAINELFTWELPFIKQCLIGAAVITLVEFVAGLIVNVWLGWGVWDYSGAPFNVLGQICLPYSVLWCLVAAIAIVLDDYIRYWFFNEEKPRYKL